jgi:hypothetical protein
VSAEVLELLPREVLCEAICRYKVGREILDLKRSLLKLLFQLYILDVDMAEPYGKPFSVVNDEADSLEVITEEF